jgi:hypothetical protein
MSDGACTVDASLTVRVTIDAFLPCGAGYHWCFPPLRGGLPLVCVVAVGHAMVTQRVNEAAAD